jgi:radical SAM-linked protein
MRVRISFSKTDEMRYTGHLDLHRAWERTFRRADLPIAYSQGFHPQPRINLAAALPLGFTSEYEVADIWLELDLDIEEVRAALTKSLPPGIKIKEIYAIDSGKPSLQSQVVASEYLVTLLDSTNRLEENLNELLAVSSLPRVRRGKKYDLRPLIEDIQRIEDDELGRPRLRMRLAALSGATGRPEEVLAALNITPEAARIHRTQLIFANPKEKKA